MTIETPVRRGGTPQTNTRVRSIDLDQWITLLKRPGIDWISLQYTDCTDQLAALQRNHGIVVHHWQQAIDDYDETAALVQSLDVVISVTTSIIHLSGALGQRVWVLVNRWPQWRYLRQGRRMPWYPSATLIRQPESGDWQDVFTQVNRRLTALQSLPRT